PEPLGSAPRILTKAEKRAQEHAAAQARQEAELAAERARRREAEDRAVAIAGANAGGDQLKEDFSQEDLEAMMWKPHGRDASRRRNNPVAAKYRGNAALNANNPNGRYGLKIERG